MQGLFDGIRTSGADFMGSVREIEAAGLSIDGAVFPDFGVTPELRSKYAKTFGSDIQIAFAANAHDILEF